MLDLREFYSLITKPVDTGKGIVILLPDKTLVFNEFNNIIYELDRIYYEDMIVAFRIDILKNLISSVDDKLEKGTKNKPDITIDLHKLYDFKLEGIFPLIDKYNLYKSYNRNVHNEEFNPDLKETILANKSDAGMYKYIIDTVEQKYIMMIYKGLIPITKADKINVSIMRKQENDIDELTNTSFMGVFNVYKPKNKLTITEYIPFRIL